MPGPTDYAQTSDVLAYIPDVPAAKQVTWPTFLHTASREIDGYCGRYFYPDGVGTKYFDVPGDSAAGGSTWPPSGMRGPKRLFVLNHDFYTVTALKVANIENGNPANSTDWTTLTGDGVVPPTDFFLEPSNQTYLGLNGSALTRPSYWIELPSYGPGSSTTFRGYFTAGKRTVSITANWGWPGIPDQIKDITVRIVIRAFKAAPTGFAGVTGGPDGSSPVFLRYLDGNDRATLDRYKKWVATF